MGREREEGVSTHLGEGKGEIDRLGGLEGGQARARSEPVSDQKETLANS